MPNRYPVGPFTRTDAIAAVKRADDLMSTLTTSPGRVFESWHTLYLIVKQCLRDPACLTGQDELRDPACLTGQDELPL